MQRRWRAILLNAAMLSAVICTVAATATTVSAQATARATIDYRIAGGGAISPDVVWPIYPAPLVGGFGFSLFVPPAPNLGFPQPLGHQVISTGPNSYVYRPVQDLGDLIDQAREALHTGDYERVLVNLDPVLTELPDDGNAWLIRAQGSFALARYGQAAEALHNSMRLLPREEWGTPVVRADRYFASRAEFAARLRALERHVAAHPGEGAGHYLLGYYYGYTGRMSEAERELRIALRVMTGSEELAEALTGSRQVPPDAERPSPGLPSDEPPPRVLRGPREF